MKRLDYSRRARNGRVQGNNAAEAVMFPVAFSAGSTSWTEEESRRNYEAVQRVVVPGDPQASRLLMVPLATEEGGDPFHPGGKHWTSRADPEWQQLAAWVRGQ